ncbi:arylesterase [Marixanthotalea marina]|uniref:arylesterase n=1 Tax=Marixanthotalea marina TaxID=2844359 RepID=UPI002989F589|nr:arylesterase [Marixanthotalea marina]
MYSKATRILLMFCYFLVLVIGISCRENTTKKTTVTEETEKPTNNSQAKTSEDKLIMFFGNSLTAGMGLEMEEGFPALIQKRLDSLELPYEVINAGLSGETTASGKNRLEWVLNQKVDIFVLELGANDGLRGVPLSETRNNLQDIIDFVKDKNPGVKIVLAGMQIPPNLGTDYTREFQKIFPELAEKNNVEFIPFLLEGVAGIPELNQGDGIHPTEKGQKIVAQNVWEVLKNIL